MITRYALPSVEHVRVDSGIEAGSAITIYYDSLLAKVAAWGENREEARLALVRALNGYHIEGLTTNVDFVNAIANHPAFIQGDLSTHFIEENGLDDYNNLPPNQDHLAYMVIAAVLVYHTRQSLVRESLKSMSPLVGTSSSPKKFHYYVVKAGDHVLDVRIEGDRITGWWDVQVDGREYEVITPEFEYYRRRLFLRINGQSHMFRLQYHEQHLKTFFCGIVRVCEIYSPDEWKLAQHMLTRGEEPQEKALRCPMPGLVTALSVKEGDYVRKGQEVLRMESMKMESSIESPRDALVAKVLVGVGQAMDTDQELILFEDS
jgi:propionyl-CoA carboxylase alpha chain